MSVLRVASWLRLAQCFRPSLALSLVAFALPALAAQGSLLEITVGPHETEWLEAKALKVLLDGEPLEVKLPAPGADRAQPVYSGVVTPGAHHLDVEAGFTGDSEAFSYVKDYVFQMKGQLDVEAPVGEAVGVQVRVVKKTGITVEWTDKFQLALRAGRHASEAAAAATVADPEPPPAAAAATPPPETPAAEPVPAVFVQQAEPTCALESPRFAFGKHDLSTGAREALDRFARCLSERGENAVIEGYADPRGPEAYNDWLSAQRARAVADYLVGKGVTAQKITVRSFGESRLVCTEATADCYAKNRRAEAVLSRP